MPQVSINPSDDAGFSDNQKKIKDITKNKQKTVKPGDNVISRKLASFWKEQVNSFDEANSNWLKKGNNVVRRYRDERNKTETDGQRKMNILWTNVQIMKPAIYSNRPTPNIDRTFLDKDPTGKLSARMLERSVRNELEDDTLHESIGQAVLDYLLPGRGQVWVRYEPEIGQGPSISSAMETTMEDELNKIMNDGKVKVDDTPEEDKLESDNSQILTERAPVDYIDWRDFRMFPAKARTWKEVQAVGKKLYISKEEALERFGEEIGEKMRPDTSPEGSDRQRAMFSDTAIFQDLNERSIVVYEIWNKTDKRVYWISTGYDYLCDVVNDPLKLKGFFPCPKPLSATYTNDTVIPVPDYCEWQDQAIQIDELTQRIALLARACKVAGTYDAANGGLRRILSESVENQLIPVDNWALHGEKGGVPGSISFLPLDQIREAIKVLQEVRQQVKQDLDEVTGLSDILRGTTDSRETLGGLRLKNNNAGTRLTDRQNEVARFARDTIRIVAEIIAKHFSDETLIKSSGVLLEDELQPAAIMEELENPIPKQQPQKPNPGGALGGAAGAGGGMPQAPGGPPPPNPVGPPGMPPQPPMPHPMPPPGPPMGPPMPAPQAPQPGQPPGGNVIPFPGGMGMMPPPPPDPKMIIAERVQSAIDLLRNDIERGYRIDIETDSTIFGDQMQERQDVIEFITTMTSFIGEAGTMGQAIPEFVPLAGKMLQFGCRRFKAGRDLESAINDFTEKMAKKAKHLSENPQPTPEEQKAQAEIQQTMLESQMQQKNDERDAQKQAANDQREFQIKQAEDQREAQKMQMEMGIAQQEAAQKQEEMRMEMEFKQQEHAIRMKELEADLYKSHQDHQMKQQEMGMKQQEMSMNLEHKEKEHTMDIKQQEKQGELDEKALAHKEKEQNMKHKERMKPKPKAKPKAKK